MNCDYYLSYASEGTSPIQYQGEKGTHFAYPVLVNKKSGDIIPLENKKVVNSIQSAIYAIENSHVHLNQLVYGGYEGKVLTGEFRPKPLVSNRIQSPVSVTDYADDEDDEEESVEDQDEHEAVMALEKELREMRMKLEQERSDHAAVKEELMRMHENFQKERRDHGITQEKLLEVSHERSKIMDKFDKTKADYVSLFKNMKVVTKKMHDMEARHEAHVLSLHAQLARVEKERDTAKKLIGLYKAEATEKKDKKKKEKLTKEMLLSSYNDILARINTVKNTYYALYKEHVLSDMGLHDASIMVILKKNEFAVEDTYRALTRLNTVIQVSRKLFTEVGKSNDLYFQVLGKSNEHHFRIPDIHIVMGGLRELRISVFVGRECFRHGKFPALLLRLIDLMVGACANMAEFNELFQTNEDLLQSFMDQEIYIEKFNGKKFTKIKERLSSVMQRTVVFN